MGNYINLNIELQAIKDFLDETLISVDAEISDILKEDSIGKYDKHLDDFSNAMFRPLEREKIALRAVFYELNALIEWELTGLANMPYQLSTKFKPPKSFADISSVEEVPRIRLVSDLPLNKVCELIEDYYKISLSKLPSFERVQFIRQSINAFKHRKGFKDFRRDKGAELLERFELKRENAYQAIESSEAFLRALRQAVADKKGS